MESEPPAMVCPKCGKMGLMLVSTRPTYSMSDTRRPSGTVAVYECECGVRIARSAGASQPGTVNADTRNG